MTREHGIQLIATKMADCFADGAGWLGEPCPPSLMAIFLSDAANLYDAILNEPSEVMVRRMRAEEWPERQ